MDQEMIDNIERLLDDPNPDRGKICDRCHMRDGHNLQYCYRCPGHYVDFKETWRESFIRFAARPAFLANRIYSFSFYYKRYIFTGSGRIKRQSQFDENYEEFKTYLMEKFTNGNQNSN
jgi:hypothetical protein